MTSETLADGISIVIPAFNEEQNIRALLDSIAGQDDNNMVYEVIVVDDCSHDRTVVVVEDFAREHPAIKLRIIKNSSNSGRFATRLNGVQAAKYDTVFFIDAKIRLCPDVFTQLKKINYTPLNGTFREPTIKNMFDLFFFLVRRKVYFREYPKVPGKYVFITPENFDRCPKGTTEFLCSKKILLQTIPSNIDRNSSDDTAWLSNIMSIKPIMIHNDFEVSYNSRNETRAILKHLFERGPKFIDYYYEPRRWQFWVINIGFILALGIFALVLWDPRIVGIYLVPFILFGLLGVGFYLGRCSREVLTAAAIAPVIFSVVGAGFLHGIALKIQKRL